MNQLSTTLLAEPRAVAIVLGPLGVATDTLTRYAQWYSDRQCSVIAACSPPSGFAVGASLRPTACQVLAHVGTALEQTSEPVPVVIHCFSNGGAYILEEIEDLLVAAPTDEYALIASRLQNGYQFFDSSPCYIRRVWDTTDMTSAFPHPHWSSVGRWVYTAGFAVVATIWCTATVSLHRPHQFWKRMLESQACRYQIFCYTTTDMLCDASAVDRFIVARQDQGVDCVVYRYNDSFHCQYDVDHAEAYGAAIDDALQAAIQRSASHTISTEESQPANKL